MTMNTTWGYSEHDHAWKSTETLIHNLVDIASKGGNYLLNIGPKADGSVPPESIERMRAVGEWMKVNGESIYGTAASPFATLEWGRCTQKPDGRDTRLYLHVFDWPDDGNLLIPGLRSEVRGAQMLANGRSLQTTATDNGVVVSVPPEPLDSINTVIVVQIAGRLEIEKVLPAQAADGTLTLAALLADIHNPNGGNTQVEDIDGQPNIGYWTNDRSWIGWGFKIDKPGRFDVLATLATLANGSELELIAADAKLTVEVPNTGSYQSFRTVTLGTIELAEQGAYELSVRPIRGRWQPINLRSIVLKPTR